MKLALVALLFLALLLSVTVVGSYVFPWKFNSTLKNLSSINEVVEVLGEPDQIFEKENFYSDVKMNPNNERAERAYYWINGMSSYHCVVVDKDGKILSYESKGY